MMEYTKRGVSPVIATVFLILLVIIIGVIILIWYRSFIEEKAQKDLGSGRPEPLERACEYVEFTSEAKIVGSSLEISLGNNGNVPIYGVEVRKEGLASVDIIGVQKSRNDAITSGDSETLSLDASGVSVGDEILIVPIVLGELGEYKKAYTCEEDFGMSVKLA
jgi:hypothetical protein